MEVQGELKYLKLAMDEDPERQINLQIPLWKWKKRSP